jgi:hypothetical protein
LLRKEVRNVLVGDDTAPASLKKAAGWKPLGWWSCTIKVVQLAVWATALDEAVNKRNLSTGETGELVLRNVGFGLNPRG